MNKSSVLLDQSSVKLLSLPNLAKRRRIRAELARAGYSIKRATITYPGGGVAMVERAIVPRDRRATW